MDRLLLLVVHLLYVLSRGQKHWVLVVNQHADADEFLFTTTERDNLLANEDNTTVLPYCRLGSIEWDNQPSPYSFKLYWWGVDNLGAFDFEFTQTTPLDTVIRSPGGSVSPLFQLVLMYLLYLYK